MGPAPLAVRSEYTLRGRRLATMTVHGSGVAWIRGTLDGNLFIQTGGRAHVMGTVLGNVVNDGGDVTIHGEVAGTMTTLHDGTTRDLRSADQPVPDRPN